MPFGRNCEYATFDECVSDQMSKGKSKKSAEEICGALKRDTEDQCSGKSISYYLFKLKKLFRNIKHV